MTSLSKTVRALCLGIALISLMVACAGYLLLSEIRRPAGASTTPVEIVVEQGDSTSAIATKLRTADLIRQPLLFTLLVRSQGLDGRLQAGRYLLWPAMTMSQIIAALQVSSTAAEVQIQTIEGMRLEEIAQVVENSGIPGLDVPMFLTTARNADAFREDYFLLNSLPSGATLEGYLFPDTYRIAATATVTDVVTVMLDRFAEQYATIETEIQVPDISVHQLVTMASIIQREATRADEMDRISAVFWNRLSEEHRDETGNGKLQADPTLQYVLGTPENWWPKLDMLTSDELNNPDPYNTRVNPGLPPGPISNPGLAALEAAAKPDQSSPYLYFVASCGDPGAHNFATTFEEFQAFEQEYLNCPTQ